MYTITTRPPTPDEQRLIAGRATFDFASYGCVSFIFAAVPAIALGLLGGWLGGFISPSAVTYGRCIGWLAGATLYVYVLASFIPTERRERRRARQDRNAKILQDIHVINPRVVEIGLINDNEPILAFEIGKKKVLYLQGQWLRDKATYGAQLLEDNPRDEFFNGLTKPHSFPSTEFTLSRFPISGEVVGIRVAGEYLAPETEVEALRAYPEIGLFVNRDLDDSLRSPSKGVQTCRRLSASLTLAM